MMQKLEPRTVGLNPIKIGHVDTGQGIMLAYVSTKLLQKKKFGFDVWILLL